eukprot:5447090-Amphidinium_carterae.1
MLAESISVAPGGPSCLVPAAGGGGESPAVPFGVAMPMSSGLSAEGESALYPPAGPLCCSSPQIELASPQPSEALACT